MTLINAVVVIMLTFVLMLLVDSLAILPCSLRYGYFLSDWRMEWKV
jgi:hypothetical protein